MAKLSKAKEVELHPDASERFEHAVNTAAKSPPQHRKVKKEKEAAKKRTPPKRG
jgi:hypothetical protein